MLLFQHSLDNVFKKRTSPGRVGVSPKLETHYEAGLPQSGKNIWKMKFFQVRENLRNLVEGQGNLERTSKVREKSGNLKIKAYDTSPMSNSLTTAHGTSVCHGGI